MPVPLSRKLFRLIEPLEQRLPFAAHQYATLAADGTLKITGTADSDDLHLLAVGNSIRVANAEDHPYRILVGKKEVTEVPIVDVFNISVDLGGADDFLAVNLPTTMVHLLQPLLF